MLEKYFPGRMEMMLFLRYSLAFRGVFRRDLLLCQAPRYGIKSLFREVRKWVGGHQDTVRGEDLQVETLKNSWHDLHIYRTVVDYWVSDEAWPQTSFGLDWLQGQSGKVI